MKRSHAVQMMYPEGTIVRFLGDDWLDSLQDKMGLIIEHNVESASEESMRVFIDNRMIDIIYDEFEDIEMEIVQ